MASMYRAIAIGFFTVRKGKEQVFMQEWEKFVRWSMSQYKVASDKIRLCQDTNDPRRYIGYAEWDNINDLRSWKERPESKAFDEKMTQFCDTVDRRILNIVREIPVEQPQKVGVR